MRTVESGGREEGGATMTANLDQGMGLGLGGGGFLLLLDVSKHNRRAHDWDPSSSM